MVYKKCGLQFSSSLDLHYPALISTNGSPRYCTIRPIPCVIKKHQQLRPKSGYLYIVHGVLALAFLRDQSLALLSQISAHTLTHGLQSIRDTAEQLVHAGQVWDTQETGVRDPSKFQGKDMPPRSESNVAWMTTCNVICLLNDTTCDVKSVSVIWHSKLTTMPEPVTLITITSFFPARNL